MKDIFRSTAGGKAGTIDGLNLFFGALIGANLGTTQGMPPFYYVELILLLAGAVITLRMLSTSPRRTYMLISLATYAIFGGLFLLWPPLQPKGVASGDLERLAITFAVWIALVLAAELAPIRESQSAD